MPVYNGDCFLKEALDSILAQTFKDFELIISDNGSTDRTQEIVEHTLLRINIVITVMNKILELAGIKVVCWVLKVSTLSGLTMMTYVLRILKAVRWSARLQSFSSLCYSRQSLCEHGQHEKYFDDFNLRSSKPHERFERYHNLVRYGHRCNPFHGMIGQILLRQRRL